MMYIKTYRLNDNNYIEYQVSCVNKVNYTVEILKAPDNEIYPLAALKGIELKFSYYKELDMKGLKNLTNIISAQLDKLIAMEMRDIVWDGYNEIYNTQPAIIHRENPAA